MAAFIREHSETRRSTSMRFCTTPLTKEPVRIAIHVNGIIACQRQTLIGAS